MMRSNVKDRLEIIAVLGAGGLVLLTLWLWMQNELRGKSFDVGSRKQVGLLDSGRETVQRKYDREILWDDVIADSVLYNRDAIRTGEGSNARIKFSDGTIIELAENSLVVLDRSEDKVGIEFLKGNVFAKGGGAGKNSGISIKTKDGNLQLGDGSASGAVNLSTGANGVEMNVTEGSARVATKQGEIKLNKHEKGKLGDGGLKKEKLVVWTESPIHNAKFVSVKSAIPIKFRWGGEQNAEIEISSDKEFSKIVLKKSGKGKIATRLGHGIYYWRVVSRVKSRDSMSDVRQFQVVQHIPVRLEKPERNERFAFFKNKPQYLFTWKMFGDASAKYLIQVAEEQKFRKLLKPDTSRLSKNMLQKGLKGEAIFADFAVSEKSQTYFWRVATVYEGLGENGKLSQTIMSEVRPFAVSKLSRLPTPALLDPPTGATIGLSGASKKVKFRWSPIIEAKQYLLRVSTDSKFKNVVLSQTVSAPDWSGEVKAAGKLYWTVNSMFGSERDGRDSKPAPARRFQVTQAQALKIITPQDGLKLKYMKKVPELEFKWEHLPGTVAYNIEVAEDRGFENVLYSKKLSKTQLKTKSVPKGTRFWRIKALGENDLLLSVSHSYKYSIEQKELLRAPDKDLPQAGERKRVAGKTKVKFEWKPIEGALGYKISISKQDASGAFNPFWTRSTKKYSVDKELDSGQYRWDVRAIDQGKRLGEAGKARVVELFQPDLLIGPVLQKPTYNSKIKSDDPQEISLEWGEVEGAQSYVISLFKVKEGGDREFVFEKKTKDNDIELPKTLNSGRYQWRVAAIGIPPGSTLKRAKKGEESESQFSVRWVGLLRAPTGFNIKMEGD